MRNNITEKGMLGAFTFLVLLFSFNLGEFQITTDPNDQRHPALYEDIVIWQDNRNGNWDIYGFNLSTQEEFSITTAPGDQVNPAIHGDIVVWEDMRYDRSNIRGYNLSTGEEFGIMNETGVFEGPEIFNNIIIWTDRSEEQVLGYDILEKRTFQISNSPRGASNPAIYENIVVWADRREKYSAIYGYDFSTGREFPIGSQGRYFYPLTYQNHPAVHGTVVIWIERGDGDIYGYNLSTSQKIAIAAAPLDGCKDLDCLRDTAEPAIYENIVVWVDYRNGNADLYGLNLETNEEFLITSAKGVQQSPELYRNMVVWEDKRNKTWDIYGIDLASPLPVTNVSSRRTLIIRDWVYTLLFVIPVSATVVIMGKTLWDITRVTNLPKNISWSNSEIKYFKIDKFVPALLAVLICFSGLFSLYIVLEMWPETLVYLLVSVIFGIFILWSVKVPYIRTTPLEIEVSRFLIFPKKIRWDMIKEINFCNDTDTVILKLSKGKRTINLSPLDDESRNDFITLLRHPPCRIPFSYV